MGLEPSSPPRFHAVLQHHKFERQFALSGRTASPAQRDENTIMFAPRRKEHIQFVLVSRSTGAPVDKY